MMKIGIQGRWGVYIRRGCDNFPHFIMLKKILKF